MLLPPRNPTGGGNPIFGLTGTPSNPTGGGGSGSSSTVAIATAVAMQAAQVALNYQHLQIISGGTFTTGIGLDWSGQFLDSEVYALPCVAGAIDIPALTAGVLVRLGLSCDNPSQLSLWVEGAATTGTIQVYCNGDIQEIASAESVTIQILAGNNDIRLSKASGPIIALGTLFSPFGNKSSWQSLYPSGEDPIIDIGG